MQGFDSTLVVKIQGDATSYQKAVDDSIKSTNKLTQSNAGLDAGMATSVASFNSFSLSALKAGGALTVYAGAAAAVVAAFGAMTGAVNKYEDAQLQNMRNEKRLKELNEDQIDGIKDRRKEIDRRADAVPTFMRADVYKKNRLDVEKEIQQERKTIARLEEEIQKKTRFSSAEGIGERIKRNVPLAGAQEAADFKKLNDDLEQSEKKLKAFREEYRGLGEAAKEASLQQRKMWEGLKADLAATRTEWATLVTMMDPKKRKEDVDFAKAREAVEKQVDAAIAAGQLKQADRQQRINALLEETKHKYEFTKQAREDFERSEPARLFLENQQRELAAFGRKGAEAFILGQRAIDKEVPLDKAKEMVKVFDQMRGKELAESVKTPFERAADDVAELNRLMQDGQITAEVYARAMEKVAKTTERGAAASRQATLVGSAEYDARRDQYKQMMQQPQAFANTVARASQEKGGTKETNGYLKEIRDAIRKDNKEQKVVLRPADIK